jgi:hypothetical protein
MAYIVAGESQNFIKLLVQNILAVGIVTVCLMRAGTSQGWDDLGVSDTHLRLSARWRSSMNKSNVGRIKVSQQRKHGSYKFLKSVWKWLFLCVKIISGYRLN